MSTKKLQHETASPQDIDAVLHRMMEALGIEDESRLGLELGVVSESTFKVWRHRKAIPQRYYATVAERTNRSVQWLKTGLDQPEGFHYATTGKPSAPDMLWKNLVAVVIDELNAAGLTLSGEKFVALVDLLHDHFAAASGEVNKELVRRHLRLVA